jgi:hypothetical protein
MHRSARAHWPLSVVAGFLLALRMIAPATILCVGSGGHLAIEEALSRCCAPEHLHGAGGVEWTASDRCPDHCTDTPLGVHATYRNPDPTSPAPHVLVASPFLSSGIPSAAPLSGRLLAPPSSLGPPRVLRTTVQLC